jgi:superfamily II DNA or RNA helicase
VEYNTAQLPLTLFDFDWSERENNNSNDFVKNKNKIIDKITSGNFDSSLQLQLVNEAFQLKLAYANNKLLSLSNSKTRILAHQVESTYIVVNTLNHRYILADEVGLGKTVEAGLILKELIIRNNFKKILIAAPASLLVQWQQEMSDKFSEEFEIVDKKILDRKRKDVGEDKNPWNHFSKIICSLDFIKNLKFREELKNSSWDMIIFDEAHRLRRDANSTTILYSAADVLAKNSKSVLLLTATPFRGKLEELYYLIQLVDPNLLGPYQTFYNSFCVPDADLSSLKEKLSSILLRRTKNEIGGFTKRHARTICFELYPEERELYENTTRYVIEEFNRAMQMQNKAVGFIMTVFQKLLDSSSYALHKALSNRRNSLHQKLDSAQSLLSGSTRFSIDTELNDLFDEVEDSENIESEFLQKTTDELKEEIKTLDYLISISSSIRKNKKGERLKKMIRELKKEGNSKFLIFTQFRTTQDYLKEILSSYKVDIFNGSMNKDEKEEAIENFKNDTEILICTEAGGEGRNMQFCNILFNYDLPWSPLKIEQRIGRLHRFGQKKDVLIYNFSTKDTVSERVLDILQHKLHLFKESIGPPDIMLGQIEDELNLATLFMKITRKKSKKDSSDSIVDQAVLRAKKSFEKLNSLTLTSKLDFNYDDYYRITCKNRQFSNTQVKELFEKYTYHQTHIKMKNVDNNVCEITVESDLEKTKYKGTFYSETALSNSKLDFFAIGHPLIDQTITQLTNMQNAGLVACINVKSDGEIFGVLFTFLVRFLNREIREFYIPVFIDYNNTLSNYELENIESDIISRIEFSSNQTIINKEKLDNVTNQFGKLYKRAEQRITNKLDSLSYDFKEELELQLDPEIKKIYKSYNTRLEELNEKLDVQRLQFKLGELKNKTVLKRTENKIEKINGELNHVIHKYKRMYKFEIDTILISAGIVI